MAGHGVFEAIGEVRRHGSAGSWMLRVGLITVEDVQWTDRRVRRFGSLLLWWLGVEVSIHY